MAQSSQPTAANLLIKPPTKLTGARTCAEGIGGSESSPLHVRLESMPGAKASNNPLVNAVRTLMSGFLVILGLVCFWVMGAAQESKLGGMDRAAGSMPSAAGQLGGDKAAYAPKEFNKDLIPEVSRKRFSDVMGCDEAKDELKEVRFCWWQCF